jgi:hypothetical protein
VPLRDTIDRLYQAAPHPTNGTAAAILATYGTLPGYSDSTSMASFRSPAGTMERLMWLAAGYAKPGDKFHAATDRAWWDRQFGDPNRLWGYMADMATVYDVAHPGALIPAFRTDMATGAPAAMREFLADAYEMLEGARAKGLERAPIGVPKLPKVPRPPGIPPDVPLPRPPLPIPPSKGSGIGALVVVGLIIMAAKGRRR